MSIKNSSPKELQIKFWPRDSSCQEQGEKRGERVFHNEESY
jgi:hypothetical protein